MKTMSVDNHFKLSHDVLRKLSKHYRIRQPRKRNIQATANHQETLPLLIKKLKARG